MCRLIETIRCDDGFFQNLDGHLGRMERAGVEIFGFRGRAANGLVGMLEGLEGIGEGRWKIRVVYDERIRTIEAMPYVMPRFESVVLLNGGKMRYGHKFEDRREIDLLTARARDSGGDVALIALEGGMITDFSYANAAFFDGSEWWTPRLPLLAGVRRESLLRSGELRLADLTVDDLRFFELCSPVNAMLGLGELSLNTRGILFSDFVI